MNQNMTPPNVPVLPHTYYPSYQTYVVTGAACYPHSNRIELSFYADKPRYQHEELEAVPGESGQFKVKDSQGIASISVREHMTAINISIDEAKAIRDLLDKVLNKA